MSSANRTSPGKTRNTRVLHDVPKRIDTPNQPIFVKIANIINEQDRYIVDGRLNVFVPRFKCDFENVQRIHGNDLLRFIVHDVYTMHLTAFVLRKQKILFYCIIFHFDLFLSPIGF